MAMMVHRPPIDTMTSKGPSKNICPRTVDSTIAPAAASVFMMESAYFKVAATSSPPAAPNAATITVSILQFDQGMRVLVASVHSYAIMHEYMMIL